MIDTTLNRRLDIERQFIALILNKNEIIDLLQIKPKYLADKELRKILEYSIECYKTYKIVIPAEIRKLHGDFNIDLYLDILLNEFWHQTAWRNQLDYSQEMILKFYKEDVINDLNDKLKNRVIDYNDFMEKMKKIDAVQLQEDTPILTIKEIVEIIDEDRTRIKLNNFNKINDTLKLVEGDFLIIGATTGAGKSGFMLNLMSDLMARYQCIYFNMEMSKPTIYKRLISINADIPMGAINEPTDYQKKLIERSLKNIDDAKLIIEHKANDIKKIKSLVAKVKNKDKHTILFIDHLGLTRIEDKKSIYEQTTEVAKQLRQLCMEYDCTIIGASQLNRSAYASEEISLNMLKDSGELENSASKVILLYRDKNSPKENIEVEMIIDVAKNRDGVTGITKMKYDKSKQIFKEIVIKY